MNCLCVDRIHFRNSTCTRCRWLEILHSLEQERIDHGWVLQAHKKSQLPRRNFALLWICYFGESLVPMGLSIVCLDLHLLSTHVFQRTQLQKEGRLESIPGSNLHAHSKGWTQLHLNLDLLCNRDWIWSHGLSSWRHPVVRSGLEGHRESHLSSFNDLSDQARP